MRAMTFFQPACRVAFGGGVVAITVLSLLPADTVPVPTDWDKFMHFAAYGGLALTGALGFTGLRASWTILIGLIVLGGALEIGQHFVGRVASIADGAANGLGALAGIAANRGIVHMKRRRRCRISPP